MESRLLTLATVQRDSVHGDPSSQSCVRLKSMIEQKNADMSKRSEYEARKAPN